jgi:hypothetical protein
MARRCALHVRPAPFPLSSCHPPHSSLRPRSPFAALLARPRQVSWRPCFGSRSRAAPSGREWAGSCLVAPVPPPRLAAQPCQRSVPGVLPFPLSLPPRGGGERGVPTPRNGPEPPRPRGKARGRRHREAGLFVNRKSYLSECLKPTETTALGCGEQLAAHPFGLTDASGHGSVAFHGALQCQPGTAQRHVLPVRRSMRGRRHIGSSGTVLHDAHHLHGMTTGSARRPGRGLGGAAPPAPDPCRFARARGLPQV